MDNSNKIRKPKISKGDISHTIVKAGLSAIPIIGGPAAEIFSAIIIPPLSKRRDEWIENIVAKLLELQEKVNEFKIESLSKNEMFITTVMYATQSAIRNHQKEKLIALQNAILNSALSNAPDDDIQLMFLNFVDTFTSWHLRILDFLDDPIRCGKKNKIAYPQWIIMVSPSTVLELNYPELKNRSNFYNQINNDLFTRGLSKINSLITSVTPSDIFTSRTTDLGKQFLKFITSPIENE